MELIDLNRNCPNTWTGNTFNTDEPTACVHLIAVNFRGESISRRA
jgi:hypothetical protein